MDYMAELEALRTGKRDELVITPAEFMAFQVVYREYQYKTQIVGEAHRGGEVHYHRQVNEEN